MDFKVGDKVSFLNDVGTAIIKEIKHNTFAIIENEDGFDEQYPLAELVPNRSSDDYKLDGLEHVESVQEKAWSDARKKLHSDFDKKTKSLVSYTADEIEIDLHIEELIDSYRGMSNAEILSVQMANFKRELNVAIRSKVKTMIVIHGVGEGVLKSEIRSELYNHYPNFEHHDASYRKYGYGATEIILR